MAATWKIYIYEYSLYLSLCGVCLLLLVDARKKIKLSAINEKTKKKRLTGKKDGIVAVEHLERSWMSQDAVYG